MNLNHVNKAIAVYLDNNDKMEREFSWLYKTWVFNSLELEYDLVVYYNPTAEERLNRYPGIKAFPMKPIRMSVDYKFLNSIYFCFDMWNEPLLKYEYILKTDCDVFLTKNLKNYIPSRLLIGEGDYYINGFESEAINVIKSLSNRYGLKYNYINHVGSSFFGKKDFVINVVQQQGMITEKLLSDYFADTRICPYSKLSRGVASMIAGEISVNSMFSKQYVVSQALDSTCWQTSPMGSNVLHIHAWHTSLKWSKHDFFLGKYNDWVVEYDQSDKNNANYCQWVATTPLEDMLGCTTKK